MAAAAPGAGAGTSAVVGRRLRVRLRRRRLVARQAALPARGPSLIGGGGRRREVRSRHDHRGS
jgi:hypothetical protein